MSKKKTTKAWQKKLNYKIDNWITKGFWAQFVLLFIAILIIVVVFGLIAGIISASHSVGGAVWQSLMHILDQGTIGGDETDDVIYVILMLVVTFLGMAFTGTIVGIINNAMSDKLDSLKKGHSQIIEEGHVVIIGFDENIYTILDQMEESNENWKGNRTIVVIDDADKEEMEFDIKEHRRTMHRKEGEHHISDKKALKTDIIYRSGSSISENSYEIASIEKARAIIINKEDDFDVIRIILALTAYLKKHEAYMNDRMPAIVSLMHEKENVSAAAIASGVYHEDNDSYVNDAELKVRNLYFEDILAHIFAQVCRQPGLSWVVSELFDYADSEIYIEDETADGRKLDDLFTGKTFGEISKCLVDSVALGIQRGTESFINPKPDQMVFEKGDKLIHLAFDDNEIVVDENILRECIGEGTEEKSKEVLPYHFLVFGWSIPLPDVVHNIDKYATDGSTIKILSRHQDEEALSRICPYHTNNKSRKSKKVIGETKISIEQEVLDPYDWSKVKAYLDDNGVMDESNAQRPTNIIIMCQDGIDKVEADEKATVLLLNIREYLRKRGLDQVINITTEMNLPEDQQLLSHTNANDFIVGSEITNRMMVQVANNTDIYSVFMEILDDTGSELYLRKLDEYVDISKPFNYNYIESVVSRHYERGENKQEIALGWIRLGSNERNTEIHLNPTKPLRESIFAPNENNSFDDVRVVVLAIE